MMAQEQFSEEVYLSFLAALVRTVNEIEGAQTEPGFGSVFMDLLKKNLDGAAAGGKEEGYDLRHPLMTIHSNLHKMFVAASLGDVLSGDANGDG